jgi:hypothetical protein
LARAVGRKLKEHDCATVPAVEKAAKKKAEQLAEFARKKRFQKILNLPMEPPVM